MIPKVSESVTSPELWSSYDRCRRLHRRHDPTYYWATRRLPEDVRPAVHALYGFVRGADELVDGLHRAPAPAERRAALAEWHGTLERGRAEGECDHPVIAALVDAGRRHDLPLEELEVYMRSMALDCDRVRIVTRAELDGYMNGSAASVGRIMAPLLGAPAEAREAFARLGVAFQLTNFIRDVGEDYALDRIYLPRQERERFGVEEHDMAGSEASPALRALLAEEVGRARELFADGEAAVAAVAPPVRPGMRLARAVYGSVLDRIEAVGFDVLGRRVTPPPWRLGRAALAGLRGAA